VPVKTGSKEGEIRRLFDPTFYLRVVEAYKGKF
jgi:hypothetical protein